MILAADSCPRESSERQQRGMCVSSLHRAMDLRPESQRLGETGGENEQGRIKETKQREGLIHHHLRDTHTGVCSSNCLPSVLWPTGY